MVEVTFFQHGSVSGTGASELVNSTGDSSTLVDAGDTLAFNGATTTLDFNPNIVLSDGPSLPILSNGTVNGVAVGFLTNVEYNYTLVLEDQETGLFYRADVFAFGLLDSNKAFLVSRAWDPVTQTFLTTTYAGQTLKVLDAGDLTSGNTVSGVAFAMNDPELNDFARGDGSLTLEPENDDAEGGTIGELGGIPCFDGATMIETRRGPVAIRDIRPGDFVVTLDREYQQVLWAGKRRFGPADLKANRKLRPVRITAMALGNGLPRRDLLVSRQHRMMVSSVIAEKMFGKREVIVPAINLTGLPGVFVDEEVSEVEYCHLLLDQHEMILAEGTPSETLFTGPEALRMLSLEAREEIITIFPDLETHDAHPKMSRFCPKGKLQKKLVARHMKNAKPIIGSLGYEPPVAHGCNQRPVLIT